MQMHKKILGPILLGSQSKNNREAEEGDTGNRINTIWALPIFLQKKMLQKKNHGFPLFFS